MPERWRSKAARELAREVRRAGGSVERTGRGRLKITGPSGSITVHEPGAETRPDLAREQWRGKVAEGTGLEFDNPEKS